MKKSTIFHSVCAMVTVLVIAGLSNAAHLQGQEPMQFKDQEPSPCSVESTNKYYKDFLASHEGNSNEQAKAFEAAKQYLACPNQNTDQRETLAQMNLAVGRMLKGKTPGKAIPYFIKAASYDSMVKSSPLTYLHLAEAYEQGPYKEQADLYKKFEGEEETDESLLALENIYQIVDRMIDAYARALALAGVVELPGVPRAPWGTPMSPSPTDWVDSLTTWYKFRHDGSAAGLKELIATILSQPLPAQPAPIISPPPGRRRIELDH